MIMRTSPAFLLRHVATAAIAILMAGPTNAQPGQSLFTIPVVFHVLHQNGPENIADAQIADAMSILNTYYDAPTWDIAPPFDTIAADMDIAFALATVDPEGNPTTGIERIGTALTENAGAPNSYVNTWPRNRYLNIWTVASLDSNNVAYLTARPEFADGAPCTDDIMIYHNYVGTIGTAGFTAKRTLTRAVGTFLNLKMLYEDPIGGGPCADDDVADTPPCIPETACLGYPNSCGGIATNEQNFMYTPYCSCMFTEGQRARAHACLSSSVAQRDELASGNWTADPDCSSTGIGTGQGGASVAAFPTPFTDQLFLSGPPQMPYTVTLLDLSGRYLFSLPSVHGGEALAIPHELSVGMYVLTVNTGAMRRTLRVVKQ